jgi:hypothetical protein
MKNIFLAFIFLMPLVAFAGTEKIKVDLDDKSTKLVVADLGAGGFNYWIDKVACLCWVENTIGASYAVAQVDCKKLKAHAKLAPHLSECN